VFPDLRHNTNLRSLRASGIKLYSRSEGGTVLRKVITSVFSQISSERLARTELEVFVLKPDDLEVVDWNELVQILSRPQFSGLYRIHVIVRAFGNSAWMELEERIRNKMYDLRNVLEVSRQPFV
jgi:hypothetical protein